jgi:hypothetical protein
MIFSAFQKEDADNVFTVVRNVSGAAMSAGESCVWDISTSVDGVRVSVPATATLSLFVGVLSEAIADSGYGKAQVYGYSSIASVTNHTTQAIAAGDILIVADAVKTLKFGAASDGKSGFVYAAQAFLTATTPAAAAKKVLIRAL